MNTSSINGLCWLASAALAGGLGYYLVDFFPRYERLHSPFDVEFATSVLRSETGGKTTTRTATDYTKEVLPRFITYNWEGNPPAPKPVADASPVAPPPKPKIAVKDLLTLLYVQVDTDDPGGSRIYVQYKGPLATKNTTAPGGTVLSVGDNLPSPHSEIAVLSIRREGVEFSFTEEGRENEVLTPGVDPDAPQLITKVGPDGARLPATRPIQAVQQRTSSSPSETREIANDLWQVGTSDRDYLAANYQDILTNDVKTRTRIDKNGRRSGIEITSVKAGSFAARHGASEGDVIISINGQMMSSEHEAINFIKNNANNTSVWEVVVERFGRLETHTYKNPD